MYYIVGGSAPLQGLGRYGYPNFSLRYLSEALLYVFHDPAQAIQLCEEVEDGIFAEDAVGKIWWEEPLIAGIVVTHPVGGAVVGDETLQAREMSRHDLKEFFPLVAEVHPLVECGLHLTNTCDASFVHVLCRRL